MKTMMTIAFVLVLCNIVRVAAEEDPVCARMNCQGGQVCRTHKGCSPQHGICGVAARCHSNPPQKKVNACSIGKPLLEGRNFDVINCHVGGAENSCPSGFECISSGVCCRTSG